MKRSIKSLLAAIVCAALLAAAVLPGFASESETADSGALYFEYGGYSICYHVDEAARPKGQIFMIHGFAMSSYCWTNMAQLLCDAGYTCVAADLPDFGGSTRETAETVRLPREEIMHALMTSLSEKPWYVAGHSMGGYVAISVAQKYPDSVKDLLLFGTSGYDGMSDSVKSLFNGPFGMKVAAPLMKAASGSDLLVRLLLWTALNDPAYARAYDISAITAPLRVSGTAEGAIYSFVSITPTDFEAFTSLPPVLYVNGSSDHVISSSARQKLAARLPEGSVDLTVQGAGHMLIENRASECTSAVLDFIAGL